MLDIRFIKKNKDLVQKALKAKYIDLDLEKLLRFYQEKNRLIKKIEELRKERNKNTKLIRSLKKEEVFWKIKVWKIKERNKQIKQELKSLEEKYRRISKKFQELMLLVPNIPSPDTPIGKTDRDNKEIFRWGEIPKFDFPIKSHIELGKELDLIDVETGVKVSGFRGYYLKNEAVLLYFAVVWHSLNKLIQKGFMPFLPPTLVKEFALIGSGHFPTGKDDIYQIANPGKLESGEEIREPIFLVGTSEPSLLAYYSDKILNEEDLPIKICGVSPCYRSEVGSYGKDTKGVYRVHEFMKVEQVIICKDDTEESNRHLEEMRLNTEEILQELELPYRVVQVCTGDMGAGKFKMYDIETWMPSRNTYGETHSDSNLTDWQARRLNIKYRTKRGEKRYVYTLNNTAIATPRILIPLLECHQQPDGSIKIPKALRPYLGNKKYISRN